MSSAFLESETLRVDRLATGERQLVRDLVVNIGRAVELGGFDHEYVSTGPDGALLVTVPERFVTDFSSIPAVFRPWFPFSKVDIAGCVHDLAYRIQMPRRPADRLWEIVATSGDEHNSISTWRGRLGYWGLRIGARWAYRDNAAKDLFRSNRVPEDGPNP